MKEISVTRALISRAPLDQIYLARTHARTRALDLRKKRKTIIRLYNEIFPRAWTRRVEADAINARVSMPDVIFSERNLGLKRRTRESTRGKAENI